MTLATASQAHTDPILWAFPFSHMAWNSTPPAVQEHVRRLPEHVRQLQNQVDTLQGQVGKTSHTSSTPPSSDAPCKKPQRQRRQSAGTRGGRTGHQGTGPTWLTPTEVHLLEPAPCACGHGEWVALAPYHTHHVIEWPPIELESSHCILHQGECAGCGKGLKAHVPHAHQAGSGPRLTALIGALGGRHRTSRRLIHDCCRSVLPLPLSLGAVPKLIDRTAQALVPHSEAMATLARQSPVGSLDETPWDCHNALHWLWTLTTDTVALSLMHPHRSTEAFFALIEAWQGLLVSDGDGVSQPWVHDRPTCLAPLLRTARGLAENREPALAACGAWALKELQRL